MNGMANIERYAEYTTAELKRECVALRTRMEHAEALAHELEKATNALGQQLEGAVEDAWADGFWQGVHAVRDAVVVVPDDWKQRAREASPGGR